MALHFNHTHKDPEMRELIRNKDVRIALSLGIDREEIIDIVYQGVGEPWQIGPLPQHVLYNEQLGRQYTDYDPKRANELLDAAGYDKKNGDGIRLFPSGKPIIFNVNFRVETPQTVTTLKLSKNNGQKLGLD